MILRFDEGLTRQEVLAQGDELAQVLGRDRDAEGRRVHGWPLERTEPVAAFAAPVLATDVWKIAQLGSVTRDTVFALLAAPLRTTEFGAFRLGFEQARFPAVWGPSIDTLLFCRAFRGADLGGVRRVLEIGPGSGFLAKHFLERAPAVEELVLVDINPHAIRCCREQIDDPRARFVEGDGVPLLAGGGWDLVLCNPPYIPRPRSIDDNPYEGVSLLVHLIEHCAAFLAPGGRVWTNVSSLCRDVVEPVVAAAGVAATAIDELEVPMKVYPVLNNPAWMRYLLERRGLRERARDGYDFWHTISITEIRPGARG